jgi:hypothetical protein
VIEKGSKFKVLVPAAPMPRIDGTVRGEFFKDEIVTFSNYTYNSYDGFPMFFFEPGQNQREIVWIGEYGDTKEDMLKK